MNNKSNNQIAERLPLRVPLSVTFAANKTKLPVQEVADYAVWELEDAENRENSYIIARDGKTLSGFVFRTVEELQGEFTFTAKAVSGKESKWSLVAYPQKLQATRVNSYGISASASSYFGAFHERVETEISRNGGPWAKSIEYEIKLQGIEDKIQIRTMIATKSTKEIASLSDVKEITLHSLWNSRPTTAMFDYKALFMNEKLAILNSPTITPKGDGNLLRFALLLNDQELDLKTQPPIVLGKKYWLKQRLLVKDKIHWEEQRPILVPVAPASYFPANGWRWKNPIKIGNDLTLYPNGKYEYLRSYGYIEIVDVPADDEIRLFLHPVRSPTYRRYETFPNAQPQTQALWPFGNADIAKTIVQFLTGKDRDILRWVCKQWFNILAESIWETIAATYLQGKLHIRPFGRHIASRVYNVETVTVMTQKKEREGPF